MDEQLLLRNQAQRVGAVLLSAEAEVFETAPLCGLSLTPCLDEVEPKGAFSRVRDAQGEARLAIWVPVELRRYTHLAPGVLGKVFHARCAGGVQSSGGHC
jgi:hypothetical protein